MRYEVRCNTSTQENRPKLLIQRDVKIVREMQDILCKEHARWYISARGQVGIRDIRLWMSKKVFPSIVIVLCLYQAKKERRSLVRERSKKKEFVPTLIQDDRILLMDVTAPHSVDSASRKPNRQGQMKVEYLETVGWGD